MVVYYGQTSFSYKRFLTKRLGCDNIIQERPAELYVGNVLLGQVIWFNQTAEKSGFCFVEVIDVEISKDSQISCFRSYIVNTFQCVFNENLCGL